MENRSLNITAFNIKNAVKSPANIVLLGKRNTGKSTMVSEVLYHMSKDHVPRAIVFSGTESVNHHYEKFGIPKQYIYTRWDENILRATYEKQKQLFEMQESGQLRASKDLRITVVIDDFGFNRQMYCTPLMNEIFMNCRHVQMSIILTLQHAMNIPPALRGQIDILLALRENIKSKREVIYKEYFSCFDDFGVFDSVMKQLTNNYKAMVFDSREPDQSSINKILFYLKAKPGRTVQFGSRGYREFRPSKSSMAEMQNNSNASAFTTKKSRVNVTVRAI